MWLRIDPTRMSHFTIYQELLIDDAYDLDLLVFIPDVVIDCGAFEGYFTLLARARFGAMRFVVFEPNAENFEGLVANIKGNGLSIELPGIGGLDQGRRSDVWGGGCGGRLATDRSGLGLPGGARREPAAG